VITFTDKLFGVDNIGQRRFERNVLCQKPAECGSAADPTNPITSLFVLVRWGTEFVCGVDIEIFIFHRISSFKISIFTFNAHRKRKSLL
jgi:hypothetical protein